jgi:hypothetical protein
MRHISKQASQQALQGMVMTRTDAAKPLSELDVAQLQAQRLQCLSSLSQVRLVELHPYIAGGALGCVIWSVYGSTIAATLDDLGVSAHGLTFAIGFSAIAWLLRWLLLSRWIARVRDEKEQWVRRLVRIDNELFERQTHRS